MTQKNNPATRRSMRQASASHGSGLSASSYLLRQPGGVEGLRPICVNVRVGDQPIPEDVDGRSLILDFDSTGPASTAHPPQEHDLVAGVDELFALKPELVELLHPGQHLIDYTCAAVVGTTYQWLEDHALAVVGERS